MLLNYNSTVPGSVRHLWPEMPGFYIDRKNGLKCYTFLHFLTPVELLTPEGLINTKPGACYVYPPDEPQYYISRGTLIHDWFHFDESTASEWRKMGLEFSKIYYPVPADFISEITQKIEAENISRRFCYEQMIDTKLSELFISIARVLEKPALKINNDLIKSCQQLRLKMLETLGDKWTIKRMADSVNISISYFHAIYKEIYGLSPVQDLINARVSNAKELLRSTDIPISEISDMLGYNNPYHFTHQFSSITGKSPKQYRNK